ncbi:MAG: peptide-methionine (R)-S-oxide reductase, partial [Opitutales bacterium]|nr:peptide-methionine (R)-S-oxide reductase [Opitutales bacterium]
MNHESESDTPDKSACGLRSEASLQAKGEISLSDEEWRQRLSRKQVRVLRQQGTESPFKNQYWNSEAN